MSLATEVGDDALPMLGGFPLDEPMDDDLEGMDLATSPALLHTAQQEEDVFELAPNPSTAGVTVPHFQAHRSPLAKRPHRRHTYHGNDGWQPGFNPISSPLREGAHLKWH